MWQARGVASGYLPRCPAPPYLLVKFNGLPFELEFQSKLKNRLSFHLKFFFGICVSLKSSLQISFLSVK